MHERFGRSLLNLPIQHKVIPVIEHKAQFARIFDSSLPHAVVLRHCNLFELTGFFERAYQLQLPVYVNVDHIDGINADNAGLRYLSEHMKITGIVSSHPRILAISKTFGLETIQRIFVLDSTGLETACETLDTAVIDMLDISPALVVPHVIPTLPKPLPLPFIASGLLHTASQVQTVLQHGAGGVLVSRDDLWNVA